MTSSGTRGQGICTLEHLEPVGPITVLIPTASVVVSQTDSDANTGCPSGQAGWYRQVLKAVVDQNGNPIELVGQNLAETVTITSPNQLNLKNPQTGTAVTDPNGQFTDTFFDCSALCPGTGVTDASQTISDILPNGSGPYNLAPNTLVYGCSSIIVNGK